MLQLLIRYKLCKTVYRILEYLKTCSATSKLNNLPFSKGKTMEELSSLMQEIQVWIFSLHASIKFHLELGSYGNTKKWNLLEQTKEFESDIEFWVT